jgi:hypothetical protein
VTRALALPKGGIVQFRYGENIVDPSTKERICGGSMAGETVVVCFIHWAEDHRNISVVPLRFAILTSARQVGSSIILEMAVDAFAAVGANPNFYDAFRTASEGRAPEHKEGSTEPVGKFAFDVPDKTFEAREADVIVGFENAVKALVQYGVFRQSEDDSANGLFFHVVDLEVRHNWIEFFPPKAVKQTATPFKATSGARCWLDIYHYYPHGNRPKQTERKLMKVSGANDLIEFMEDTELIVDSEYDLKRVEFKVASSSTPHWSALSVYVLGTDGKSQHAKINLPLRIRPSLVLLKLQLAFITIGISGTALVALATSGKPIDGWAIGTVLVSGLVVALAATFGFKRGI